MGNVRTAPTEPDVRPSRSVHLGSHRISPADGTLVTRWKLPQDGVCPVTRRQHPSGTRAGGAHRTGLGAGGAVRPGRAR